MHDFNTKSCTVTGVIKSNYKGTFLRDLINSSEANRKFPTNDDSRNSPVSVTPLDYKVIQIQRSLNCFERRIYTCSLCETRK